MGQNQSYQDESSSQSTAESIDTMTTVGEEHFRLLDLPSEIIDQILTSLPPVDLSKTCQTCKTLNYQGSANRLWKTFLRDSLPHDENHSHNPFESWKEMYGIHYPYWFLPKYKIWFADRTTSSNPFIGQLILVRYDYRIGSIEGYRLVAEHPEVNTFFQWTHDTSVLIHNFDPRVSIFLDDPIVKIDHGAFGSGLNRLQQEVPMSRGPHHNSRPSINSSIFPTIPIPPHRQARSMSLWPPFIIPAKDRVRTESPSLFKDPSHKPKTYDEMSEMTFRLRRWLILGGFSEHFGFRTSEDVVTYSTILPEYYTPTIERPYQGLFIGDYAGHGCEFLLIIQSTPDEAQRFPAVTENPARSIIEDLVPRLPANLPHISTPDPVGCQGRLDAIKLTGDPNIPRGEATWIAEDISRTGLIRIAQEKEFRGARVVKSSGHIAGGGFRNDRYTPGQLIMISEDKLAQYWVVSNLP